MAHTWMFFNTLLFSLLIMCTDQDTNCSKSLKPTVVRLNEYLLDGYKKGMRPVNDWRNATVVHLDLAIYAILGVNEKDQLLRSYMWLKQTWVDEFLQWDPKDFDNITQVSIPAQLIWTPDIIVLEFVESTRSPEAPYVYLKNNGRVLNMKPLLITTACSLNIYSFPYDTQNCSVTFTSWIHTALDIIVKPMEKQYRIKDFKSTYLNDGEWELVSSASEFTELHSDEIYFGELQYMIVIRRKPLFYSMTLIIPSIFLMVMDISGFYLPPESGERISFKITLLLGYSVFLIVISDTLPGVGTPLLGVYYTICMGLLVVSLIQSIFIVRTVHQQNIHLQIPGWVKTLILKKMPVLLCMKGLVQNYISKCSQQIENDTAEDLPNCKTNDLEGSKETSVEVSPTKENEKLLSSILKEIASIRQHVKKTYDDNVANEWLLVGYILDMFLFRTYICVVTLFALTMLIMWFR
ncbi:5-hydroxytryptamine receptor 3A-like [Hyla sarda]|uniref:5-hydroxytryptamine receptor 3A-like n=1 Tax=Hyla sarda TaxID=327740 RepID=UPI0024C29DE3|nr:5-hydroxytryptamine receptor 3A-like [Hyla sarda]